ncbi:PREDICTED: uncharacterized protein LOC109587114 isoform X2 [Amphimedon queenslandica]|uniref:C2 domain-containing protein n=1 Tax=Amphimedon queenslandica TaxID=400682 RepID=A0AAN0JQ07_AMPQE|nr:PREDICTED: uncharacterized protein LOC109587114 isoform X2 [Amphimedon queenslandica]|eukprot:XP_019858902.1 PREDICTED: uncharacterized protein LOC109587114 isoform X2 [Amphimedon queenslandica]
MSGRMSSEYRAGSSSGHVFKPSLQDISLKRFRMRYSTISDCYYLHWDNTVCPALCRINGLENGSNEMDRLTLVKTNKDTAYITSIEDSNMVEMVDSPSPPSISWKFDFSGCGLAVKSILIKARHKTTKYGENLVTFSVEGDRENEIKRTMAFSDYLKEVPILRGSKMVKLTATLHSSVDGTSNTNDTHFLTSSTDDDDCPLDIIINLMCPQPESWPFIGEVLLGLKYNPSGASDSLRDKSDITVDCGLLAGQLQVHLVEGDGLGREKSKKPLNSFLKCAFLPDPNSVTSQQTSPKTSAYPTWSKELIYAGIDNLDLLHGGLEVLLYDHHLFFNDSLIGGLRLSIPQRRSTDKLSAPSVASSNIGYLVSPPNSRCSSPGLPASKDMKSCLSHERINTPTLLLNSGLESEEGIHSSTPDLDQAVSSRILKTRPASFSASSINDLTILRKVPVFTLPNRDSPLLSPRFSPSPILRRKRSPKHSPKSSRPHKTDYIHDWMDSTGDEVVHWSRMLDSPGEWAYCWHLLRGDITPANEL